MEGQQQPTPEQPQPPLEPVKKTALEVRNDYAVYAVAWLAACLWFAYDGWLNKEIHSYLFNRIGAFAFGVCFLFCIAMAVSAHRAFKRRQQ